MLTDAVERYIALRRATGFKFMIQACLLRLFVRYAATRRERWVRGATVLGWAASAPSPRSRNDRLQVLRTFARVAAAEDPRHEVPPAANFGPRGPRPAPHIFSEAEIGTLLHAASKLGPSGALKPKTFVTLFALLVATGLRVSEALALHMEDVTLEGLVVRNTKFRKSRLVPLHESARRGLARYVSARAREATLASTVFVSTNGTALPYSTVNGTFLSLVRNAGLHPGPGRKGPRIHDLRHTFAVRSLEACSGNGDAVRRHMVALSTYLGHTHVTDTYWYLQATPRLLIDIARAAEAHSAEAPR